MEINLTKFTDTNSRYENRITVTRSRSLGFPTHFSKENEVGSKKYAVLYYDKENSIIGIRFSNEAESGTFSIVHSKQGYGGSVVATSFFNANNIDTSIYYGRYDWEKKPAAELGLDDGGDVFLIKLTPHKINNKGDGLNEMPVIQ